MGTDPWEWLDVGVRGQGAGVGAMTFCLGRLWVVLLVRTREGLVWGYCEE